MKLIEALTDAVGSMTMIELLAKPYEDAGIRTLLKQLTESDIPWDDQSLGFAAVLYKMAGIAIVGSLAEVLEESEVAQFIDCINLNSDNLAMAFSDVFGDRGLFPFPVSDP